MIAQLDKTYIKTSKKKTYNRLYSHFFFQGRPLTTPHQFLNGTMIFPAMRLLSGLPKMKKVEKPIFILGIGRSGTTIIGVLLSMHKDVGFLNEPKAAWHFFHGEEDLIGTYSMKPARYRMSAADVKPFTIQRAHKLYGNYLAFGMANRVVDKYPELLFRYSFVEKIFPDAKFLVIVRNGINVSRSIARWSVENTRHINGEVHNWWGRDNRKYFYLVDQLASGEENFRGHENEIRNFTREEDKAAVEWILNMRESLALEKQHPENVMLFRYEDLVADPREILGKIEKFSDLPHDEKMITYAENTLQKSSSKKKKDIELNPLLQPSFNYYMQALGYN
jgi:hypothetical protein